jgi:hypothetical protein
VHEGEFVRGSYGRLAAAASARAGVPVPQQEHSSATSSDDGDPLSEKCPLGKDTCCCLGFIENALCKDCDCEPCPNSHENRRARASLDASPQSEEIGTALHLSNGSSISFPVSVSKHMSKLQIVFFNTEIASMTASQRIEILITAATSGMLGKALRVKIGDRFVIDKTKVIDLCFVSHCNLFCNVSLFDHIAATNCRCGQ